MFHGPVVGQDAHSAPAVPRNFGERGAMMYASKTVLGTSKIGAAMPLLSMQDRPGCIPHLWQKNTPADRLVVFFEPHLLQNIPASYFQ